MKPEQKSTLYTVILNQSKSVQREDSRKLLDQSWPSIRYNVCHVTVISNMHVYKANDSCKSTSAHQLRAVLTESTSQPCTAEEILQLLLTPLSLWITINRDL